METLEKLRVNGKTDFECFFINDTMPDMFEAVIKSDDYSSVVKEFSSIEKLEILDVNGLVRKMTTAYSTLKEVKTIFNMYTDEDGKFITPFRIGLAPHDLKEQVDKLEKQVNPVVDESAMSLDEFKAYKIKQLGKVCTTAIYAGTEVETSKGKEMFSYNLEDQSNLKDLFATATATGLACPYHPNSGSCVIYSAEDIVAIYLTLSAHKLYHTTYANALNTYIRDLYDKAEIKKVTYGQEVTGKYKENMDAALAQGELALKALLSGNTTPEPEEPSNPEVPPEEITPPEGGDTNADSDKTN